MDIARTVERQAAQARKASFELAVLPTKEKDRALKAMAAALWRDRDAILVANALDVQAAQKAGLASAMIERLVLNAARIKFMADGVEAIIQLPDPLGEITFSSRRPNGLKIERVRVPIGVVAIIYESRPNVTCDCAALGIKSGNAVILRGGKEAILSNMAIYKAMKKGLAATRVPVEALQLIGATEREAIVVLLGLDRYIDLVVPRGGEGLIRFVAENSRIPVVKHYKGVCHTYVDAKADLKMASEVCFNAKVNRPGVCNAMEKMLVHRSVAAKFLPGMIQRFREAGVEIRGDRQVRALVPEVRLAVARDWDEEYLDLILAVKEVSSVQEAVEHINAHGSRHSDAIVTRDRKAAELFLAGVDSACVYVNASTRFTDGYQFGLGAEIGISTDKLHVRGPMGLEGLTTYKYRIHGCGQIRG